MLLRCATTVALLACCASVVAQGVAPFPSPYQSAPPLVPVTPNFGGPGVRPGATLGTAQSFDPYSIPNGFSGSNVPGAPAFPSGRAAPNAFTNPGIGGARTGSPGFGIGSRPGAGPTFGGGGIGGSNVGGSGFGSNGPRGFPGAPSTFLQSPSRIPPPQITAPPSNVWPGQTPSFTERPGGLPPNGISPNGFPGGGLTSPPPGVGLPYGQPAPPSQRGAFGAPNAGLNADPYFRGSPFDGQRNRAGGAFGPSGFGNSGGFGAGPTGYGPGRYGDNQGGGYGYGNDVEYAYGQNPQGNRLPLSRLFQDTGLRGTYLHGSGGDDLSITEAEASTTAYFANFLGIPNGLRVTPGFAFHWLDGPHPPTSAHAPSRLYSAYLDFGIEPQFTPRFGAEVSARIGVYSDFNAFNTDSIRILGTGVGVYQMTPQVAVKVGAAYIDRLDVKFLPAGGILWTPNPQTRWDIFFPAPKLANYWTTINNSQVWWYLGGEYGGGSWSIEREEPPQAGADDRMDINDIRVYLGVELWNLNRFYSFAEVGYVFERELVFELEPTESTSLSDTFMVRAGVSW